VLAVTTVRGWRPAATGAFAGLALLVFVVFALGPLLDRIPLRLLQFVIGILLLLFGMRWLRKAILRAGGIIALHDEAVAFATETEELRDQARRHDARLDWLAGLASFKAVCDLTNLLFRVRTRVARIDLKCAERHRLDVWHQSLHMLGSAGARAQPHRTGSRKTFLRNSGQDYGR